MSDDLISLDDARATLRGAETMLARTQRIATNPNVPTAERDHAQCMADTIGADVRVLRTLIGAYERLDRAHATVDRLLGAIQTIRSVATYERVVGEPPTAKMLDDALRAGGRIGGDVGDAVVGTVMALRALNEFRGKAAP